MTDDPALPRRIDGKLDRLLADMALLSAEMKDLRALMQRHREPRP